MENNAETVITETASTAKEKPAKKKRKWPKILFGTLGILLLGAVILAVVKYYGAAATMLSLKHVDGQLYQVTYRQDYKLDEALSAEIVSEEKLLDFITQNLIFDLPFEINKDYFACSAFLTEGDDGRYLVGRNLDFNATETLTLYTAPKDGYASIGNVMLGTLNVGAPSDTEVTGFLGRASTLAAPYLCVDGMNEKGFSVSVLDLGYGEIHKYTEKPDLVTTMAVRLLLDRAANVDEAIALLEQYDFHSLHNMAQHLFLADASGRSVIVEWPNNDMVVVENNVCTNFWLSKVPADSQYAGRCDRFDTLTQRLADQPVNTPESSMDNLKAASVSWTQWSCVYHLSDFSMDISLDTDYSKVYHLTPDDFR